MKLGIRILSVGVLCGLSTFCGAAHAGPIIVGYIFPNGASISTARIDVSSVDRINYAFAIIKNGRLATPSQLDDQNLALLVGLKRKNPSLSILISVGGWLGSANFSDMALTAKSRSIFINSVMDFLSRRHLDGLDIDWEYPGLPGAGHTFRPQDKRNFTLMVQELRARFDKQQETSGRRLYLTIAAGASEEYLEHTEMQNVQRFVDAVDLMAYDFNEGPWQGLAGHQSPLFTNPANPNKDSADASVRDFQSAGVPAAKLILGVPFYGRVWEHVEARNNGLFQRGKPSSRDFIPYNMIASTLLGHGYTRYWDAASSAAYLYNSEQKTFVSYEDSASLAAKSSYVLTNGLGGVMFWKYSDDPNGELLGGIAHGLHPSGPAHEP